MHHTDKQLDRLHNLLIDMPAENDGMLLSELDGFIAGIVVCPKLIMPSQWLPEVWGDQITSPFENEANANELHSAVMNHYNRVVKTLEKNSTRYEPIYEVDRNSDETLWEIWACGFERAMRLNPDCWEQVVEGDDEEASSSVVFLLSIARFALGEEDFSDDKIQHIDAVASDMIPQCIATLHNWRIAQAQPSQKQDIKTADIYPFPRKTKIGRNDPCYCGSGRKYKKCCGAN